MKHATIPFSIWPAMLLLTLASYLHRPLQAQSPGSLDPAFDTDGIAITDFSGGTDIGASVAVQSDGKVVVAGIASNDFALTRYTTSGTLDTSFDGDGRVRAEISLSGSENGRAVAIQSDGKIVVAGDYNNGGNQDFAVMRFNAGGSLDTAFDGDGKVVTAVGTGYDSARDIAIQSDGKILVAGTAMSGSTAQFALLRYNSNGSLDTTFNGTGKATANPGVTSNGENLAIQPDGKILVTGWVNTSTGFDWIIGVARFNSNGTLDTGFDGDGMLLIPWNATGLGVPGVGITVQSDGKIIIASRFDNTLPPVPPPGGGSMDIGVWRLNTDGSPDMTFDGDGIATTDISADKHDCAYQVAVQGDGKIVVAGLAGFYGSGSDPLNVAVVRFNSNGSLDASFNGTGKAESDIDTPRDASTDYMLGLALQADGKIVVAGTSSGSNFAALRYIGALAPEIVVEQPAGTNIADGGSKAFGTNVVGGTVSLMFTIKNIGSADLTGLTITKDGANQSEFSVTSSPTAPVSGPTGTTTFTIQFAPTAAGAKTAAIHIASNDADENPFDINLTGTALSFTDDTDGDGMNDASEFQMASLGFNYQVSQTALVNTYASSANGAGYYTPAQVQALNVGVPLIQKNPTTGVFTLTIGVEKSTDLSTFSPFPMTGPGTSTLINGAGKLEFQFTVPDNAAFFQLRAQ